MKYIILLSLLLSCGTTQVISTEDITHKTHWIEDNEFNPVLEVIQKIYKNDDVEIIIKKKLTTDYVKLMLRRDKKRILKTTVYN